MQPASWYSFSWRVRLVARATGTRAAAPADVFQALAVIPADAPLGHDHAVHAEAPAERTTAPRLRGSVTESSATISGGSPARRGQVEQVVRVGVLVGRDLEREALVHGAVGHPVELVAGHLEHRDAAVGGHPEHLAQPVVALGLLGDVQRRHRDVGLQRLDDGVAPGHPLGVASARPHDRSAGLLVDFSTRLRFLCALWPSRSLAFGVGPRPSRPPCAAVRPSRRSGCRLAVLLDRAVSLAVAWHQRDLTVQRGPCGVSSISIPASLSWSRMASAAAKSLRTRPPRAAPAARRTSASTAP